MHDEIYIHYKVVTHDKYDKQYPFQAFCDCGWKSDITPQLDYALAGIAKHREDITKQKVERLKEVINNG